jgi:hypothetical protein
LDEEEKLAGHERKSGEVALMIIFDMIRSKNK